MATKNRLPISLTRALALSTAAKHLPGIVDSLEGLGSCCLEYCQYRYVPLLLPRYFDKVAGSASPKALATTAPRQIRTQYQRRIRDKQHRAWVNTGRSGLYCVRDNEVMLDLNATGRDAISLFKRALARNVEIKDLSRDARLFRLLEKGHRRMVDEVRPERPTFRISPSNIPRLQHSSFTLYLLQVCRSADDGNVDV